MDIRRLPELRRSSRTAREQAAEAIYQRLHPVMAALGLLFFVLVLAQSAARSGTVLHVALLAATWALWAVFVVDYVLRVVIAPSTAGYLRRTWWQGLFLLVPFLTVARSLLVLRMSRPARVAVAALRGSRSARATMSSRAAWLGIITTITVFAAADLLYRSEAVSPYGKALHAAALAAITGEPTGSGAGLAQVMDVLLSLYAVVFFATLAGILGSFFVERRREVAHDDAPTPTRR